MIRLVLIRHGESTADLDPVRIEGQADFPLTEAGQKQARALGKRMSSEYQLDLLIASPLKRAYQTATAIADATGHSIQTDARLMERSHGIFGGLTGVEARTRHPELTMPWELLPHEAPTEGESFLQHHARVAEFWFSLYHGADDRSIAVVTHGGTITILYQLALGLPVRNQGIFFTDDTGLHEWQFEPGAIVLVKRANCTHHLL